MSYCLHFKALLDYNRRGIKIRNLIIRIIIQMLPACFDNLSGTLRKEKQNNTNNTINIV